MTCSIKFLYSLKITYQSSLTFINAFVNRYSLFNKSILGVISTTCNHAKVNRVNIVVIDEMAWTPQKAEGKKNTSKLQSLEVQTRHAGYIVQTIYGSRMVPGKHLVFYLVAATQLYFLELCIIKCIVHINTNGLGTSSYNLIIISNTIQHIAVTWLKY